jgi:hypothetical protein
VPFALICTFEGPSPTPQAGPAQTHFSAGVNAAFSQVVSKRVIASAAVESLFPGLFHDRQREIRWIIRRLATPSIERFLVSAKFVQNA